MARPSSTDLDIEDLIVAALRRLMRAVDLHSHRLVDEFGLTGPQLATLRQVGRRGPLSSSALAQSVHLSNATITGIVSRLERRGLVARARTDSDRRIVQVTITDAGRALLDTAPSLLQDRFRKELTSLASWEQTMMLANLQRIASMMDAELLDAAPHLMTGGSPVPEEAGPGDTGPETPRHELRLTPRSGASSSGVSNSGASSSGPSSSGASNGAARKQRPPPSSPPD